jgi:hypothetical protein
MWASPGRRERNTSLRPVESAARSPKVHLRQWKTAMSQLQQAEEQRSKPAARAALRPPAKRQSHGSRPQSTRCWGAKKAVADHQELSVGWVLQESKTSPADNPEQPLRVRRESRPPRWAKAPPRLQARPLPAAPRKTRWRVLQSLPDRALPTSDRKRHCTSGYLLLAPLLAWKTMSVRRSLTDHLYS